MVGLFVIYIVQLQTTKELCKHVTHRADVYDTAWSALFQHREKQHSQIIVSYVIRGELALET